MKLFRDLTQTELDSLAARYRAAQPFPHVFIDDLVHPEALTALQEFPPADWPHWYRFADEYQRGKRTCDKFDLLPAIHREMVIEASSPAFLKMLEHVTGIQKLLPDPYLDGGGLHVSGPGGVLAPHTDFHVYQRLNLYRVLNVILYLNPDWKEGDGGALQLFAPGATKPAVAAPPLSGRLVIFGTDDRSVHGFTDPIGEGVERKSLALYYYTSRDREVFSGDTSTHWRRERHFLFDALINISRAFAKLARMTDPHA